MDERRNRKLDYRTISNNRKNGYRNYVNRSVWEHRRNEDYDGYKYEQEQYDYRQGIFQSRELSPTVYPAEYRHSNSSQDHWRNNIGGSSSTSTYYNQNAQYSGGEHRNSNYSQHQQISSHPQYDYVPVATFAPIQQTNASWQQSNNRFPHNNKRRSDSDGPSNHKLKKKKPLSQNVPSKREWTIEDAKKAINIEMEFSKRFKQNSLMIKFPDIDINKEIVSKFHTSIENVHFQQPSTARYCFVTLNDNADGDAVIKALNATKFGEGYLTAEYKKERDDQIVSPEDIDPLTLYVGNLVQEITKLDLEQIYTKKKRIDIGFGMKMKKTRYAFISFWNVDDSIEAYTRTRSIVLYSKSLIVRFRRLHGTVGLPGEPKVQNPPKNTNSPHVDLHNEDGNSSGDEQTATNPSSIADRSNDVEENSLDVVCDETLVENVRSNSSQSSHLEENSKNELENAPKESANDREMTVDLSLVKQEKPDYITDNMESNDRDQFSKSDEADRDIKPPLSQFDSPFLPSYVINELNIQHRPIKEELSQCEAPTNQDNSTSDKNEHNDEEISRNESNNLDKNDFFQFEMDMITNVDFNSIYKSIQAKPAT